MNEPVPDTPSKDQLIEHFAAHNTISGKLQYEMSKAILKQPGRTENLEKQSKLSEEAVFQILLNVIRQLLELMPLAQLHRINLSCWIAKLHADLTGDSTMQEVMEEINRRVHNKEP